MRLVLAIAAALFGLACSDDPGGPGDAGDDRTSTVKPDGAAPGPDAGPRLLNHEGGVVSSIELGVIYVGAADAGAAPPLDVDLSWLVGSPYWLLLDEYGIGNGGFAGTARVATGAFFQSGDVDANGRVDLVLLQTRLISALHGDADAGTAATISIPGANAYALYLPDGINVALGQKGTYIYTTCIDSNGYHAYDGFEPYAVFPPCPIGRSLYAASHELAELVTDPEPYDGWVSDHDIPVNGGEVADLCAEQILQEGVYVTRLWSNSSAGCVP